MCITCIHLSPGADHAPVPGGWFNYPAIIRHVTAIIPNDRWAFRNAGSLLDDRWAEWGADGESCGGDVFHCLVSSVVLQRLGLFFVSFTFSCSMPHAIFLMRQGAWKHEEHEEGIKTSSHHVLRACAILGWIYLSNAWRREARCVRSVETCSKSETCKLHRWFNYRTMNFLKYRFHWLHSSRLTCSRVRPR